jgi:hypothetical protein
MAKTWVLETHTKGTGANIVPLGSEQDESPPEREALIVHPPAKPRPPKPPEARRPRRFKVVDVTTREVLADDASTLETLAALRDVHSVVDVAVSVWSDKHDRYRLLTHAEQRAMWDMRDAQPGPTRQAAIAQP